MLRKWPVTEGETLLRLIPAIAESDNGWSLLPSDWRARVTDELDHAPVTDDAWDGMRVFHAGSWLTRDAYDERQRRNEELLIRYRRGVEAIRDMIGDADDS